MAKKKQQIAFWKNIKFKYKLTLTDENSLEEVGSMQFTKLNGILLIAIILITIFALASIMIAYTPLRNFLPGYMNSEIRTQVVNNALKVDSLIEVANRQNLYIMNIQDIFAGNIKADTIQSIDSLTSIRQDSLINRSEREIAFRREYEEREKYNLSSIGQRSEVAGVLFHRPTQGIITNKFDTEKKHLGIDIAAQNGESVVATLDGTVIMSTYTADTGYVIMIQHNQDLLSVYKHCSLLLKQQGETVKAGEAIALAGSSGTLAHSPHLHFELWRKGKAVNPETLIAF